MSHSKTALGPEQFTVRTPVSGTPPVEFRPAPVTVGRIVHYRGHGSDLPWPAMVTVVHDAETVDMVVFLQAGISFRVLVSYEQPGDGDPGSWVWPPRA